MRKHGHGFPGGHDAAFVHAALSVEGELEEDGGGRWVVLTLASRAGHATPTGDLFRGLVLRLRADEAKPPQVEVDEQRVRTPGAVFLGCTFVRRLEGDARALVWRKRLLRDTRIPPEGRLALRIQIPRTASTLRNTLKYHFQREDVARRLGLDSEHRPYVLTQGEVDLTTTPLGRAGRCAPAKMETPHETHAMDAPAAARPLALGAPPASPRRETTRTSRPIAGTPGARAQGLPGEALPRVSEAGAEPP
jgi:hypothetical protein